MSNPDGSDIMRRSMKRMAFWLVVGIGLSLGINFGFFMLFGDAAFPYNVFVLVGLFLLMGYLIQRRELKKVGAWKEKPKGTKGGFFSRVKGKGRGYTCYNCSTDYKGDRCPKCGARGGKMSFE